MTYQDYVDQPRTLEAALECIRRLTVERDRLRVANRELREEVSVMATECLTHCGQDIERDVNLEGWSTEGTFGHLCCGVCNAAEGFVSRDFDGADPTTLHNVVAYIRDHDCADNCVCEREAS